jgi:hypothetical protein
LAGHYALRLIFVFVASLFTRHPAYIVLSVPTIDYVAGLSHASKTKIASAG